MGNIDHLEEIAIKMTELYSRETKTNYDEELEDNIYKLLRGEQ